MLLGVGFRRDFFRNDDCEVAPGRVVVDVARAKSSERAELLGCVRVDVVLGVEGTP